MGESGRNGGGGGLEKEGKAKVKQKSKRRSHRCERIRDCFQKRKRLADADKKISLVIDSPPAFSKRKISLSYQTGYAESYCENGDTKSARRKYTKQPGSLTEKQLRPGSLR